MKKTIAIVMDPIESINFKKDTTLAMMWAAQDKGWQIFYLQQHDLYLDGGKAMGLVKAIKVSKNSENFYRLDEETSVELGKLDAILMRKDPPFDNNYIYSTYILEAAERQGCLVVNKPQSLRDCNEKIFATEFAEFTPPLLVSSNTELLRKFHQQHQDVIFKPLDGMGGTAIFRAKPDEANLGVIIELLTDNGNTPIMAQTYLPAIKDGDKRILIVDGKPIDYALARIPQKGETRGNLAAGGTGRPQPLSERDREIANAIGPIVKEKGLLFVGLDIIGEYVTEINVTSPTCVREIDNEYGTDIAAILMDTIEKKLNT